MTTSPAYRAVQQKVLRYIDHNVWIASSFGILVFANIFMFIVELDAGFLEKYQIYFDILEFVSMLAFTIDYCLRIWACTSIEKYSSPVKGRLKYMVTPLMIADILPLIHLWAWAANLPQYIPLNVIIFRIFRLFRLNHVTDIVQRKQIFYEIFEGEGKSKYHTGFALFIGILILVDLGAVLLEFVHPFYEIYAMELRMIEYFTLFVFTFEYILRVWTCNLNPKYSIPIKGRLMYVLRPLALIDLLTILPFFIPLFIPFEIVVLRVFRLFRLFRVLKFAHFHKSSPSRNDQISLKEKGSSEPVLH